MNDAVTTPQPGMPRPDLDAWADALGVRLWLERRARDVFPASSDAHYRFGWWTLAQLVTGITADGSRGRVPRGVQDEVVGFLLERADDVTLAAREESARMARWTRPAESGLADLYDHLRDLRNRERERVAPRPVRAIREAFVGVETDPPTALYHEPQTFTVCTGRRGPQVRIGLTDEGPDAGLACDCPRGPDVPAHCGLRLSALDAVLDVISGHETPDVREQIRHLLTVPAWARALQAIDRTLAWLQTWDEAGAPEDDSQLGWRIALRRDVQLVPVACRSKKRGDGFVLRRLAAEGVTRAAWPLPHAADRIVVEIMADARPDPSDAAVSIGAAIEHLVGHPRVFLAEGSRGGIHVALRRSRLALRLERLESGELELATEIGGRPAAVADVVEALATTRSGNVLLRPFPDEGVVWLTRLEPGAIEVLQTFTARPTRFPAEATSPLVSRLMGLSSLFDINLDASVGGRAEAGDNRLIAQLGLEPDGGLVVGLRVQPLPEVALQPPGEGPPVLFALRDEALCHVTRDQHAERLAAHALADELGLGEPDTPATWHVANLEESLALIERLREREGLRVVWEGRQRRVVAAGRQSLRLTVSRQAEWLALGGGLDVEGTIVSVPALLAALRAGRRFVEVDGDTWVDLHEALRRHLAPLAWLAEQHGDTVEVSPLAGPLLEELLDEQAREEADWVSLRDRMDAAAHLEVPLPTGLSADLRSYQRAGFEWLARLAHWAPGACLADDMGLGKTVQALALLLRRAELGPALVVAPTSVGFNWTRESERFAPDLRVVPFRGKAYRDRLVGLGPGDVLVTSYDLVARYGDEIGALSFSTLVLDEAQAFKNPDTLRARAIFGLKVGFTVALTGTPIENRTAELWSLFRALLPGLLGSARSFRERFVVPIERDRNTERRRLLANLVRPFILRRVKSEVARELPPRTEIELPIALSRAERALYDRVRLEALQRLADVSGEQRGQKRMHVLAALTRLRQLACDPRLVEPDSVVPSSKLGALRDLLRELVDEGHRALVFSQFTSLLAHVKDALRAEGLTWRYLDGNTPEARRRDEVDAFQRGASDVFLLSLRAGGTGLNLTAADYVVHLDPWWNPAVEDQATNRAHRIGQDKPVTVYRLIARGTIEEAVLALHAEKRELVAALLEGTDTTGALSTDELIALLTIGDDSAADDESL